MTNDQLATEIRYLRQQLDRGVSVNVFWKTVFAIIVAQLLMMVLGLVMFLFIATLGLAGVAAGANQAAQQRASRQAAMPQPAPVPSPQPTASRGIDEQRAAWEAQHRAFEAELQRLSDPG
ncbi:hypothetical protein AY599_15865 [Leptolyngbya valderiana BDU 20041]|nr:hypothetical protein AY599_15865 [Leptolyngbya valderiana BDU 20041]